MSITLLPPERAVRVTVKQVYGGLAVNVFHYLAAVPPSNADLGDFLDAFKSVVWDKVRVIQAEATVTSSIEAQLLGGSLALASRIYNQNSLAAVVGMPTEATYTFRFARTSAGVRGGYKRFTGVTETSNDFGVFPPSFLSSGPVLVLETALTAVITATAIDYTPIVIVNTYNGQPLPQPYYWTPQIAKLNPIVGTQLTRRRGRGA